MITATKRHEICIAHRLPKHKGKCSRLHGHNLVVEVTWDHSTIMNKNDPRLTHMTLEDQLRFFGENELIKLPFDPTVENIARHWMFTLFPKLLSQNGAHRVSIWKIRLYETEKCYAEVINDEVTKSDD